MAPSSAGPDLCGICCTKKKRQTSYAAFPKLAWIAVQKSLTCKLESELEEKPGSVFLSVTTCC